MEKWCQTGFNQDPLEYEADILPKDQISESQIETYEDEKEVTGDYISGDIDQ